MQAAQRWAGQAETRAFTAGKHQVARLGHAGQPHQGDRVKFAHARLDAENQVADCLRCVGRGELKICQLIDIVDGAQAVGRMHEKVVGVVKLSAVADDFGQDLDDEGGDFQRMFRLARFALVETLPAGDAEALTGFDAGLAENVPQHRLSPRG